MPCTLMALYKLLLLILVVAVAIISSILDESSGEEGDSKVACPGALFSLAQV